MCRSGSRKVCYKVDLRDGQPLVWQTQPGAGPGGHANFCNDRIKTCRRELVDTIACGQMGLFCLRTSEIVQATLGHANHLWAAGRTGCVHYVGQAVS